MMNRVLILVAVGLTAAWVSTAWAQILIDDFTTGPGFTAQGGYSTYRSSADGLDPTHTIGGHRSFSVQSCLYPIQGTLPIQHDPVSGTIAVGGTGVSQWCEGVGLTYGRYYGADGPELDFDLLAEGITHLEIDLLMFDRGDLGGGAYEPMASLDLSTRYTYISSSGSSFEASAYQFHEFALPEVDEPTTVRIPLGTVLLSAEGEYDPTNIDSIGLYTGGAGGGGELVISAIRLVRADEALAGDYNADGFVSQADLDLVLLNWGDSVVPPEWLATDQFDGVQVSQNELDGVLLNWGDGTPPSVTLPEPASLTILATALAITRRRRSCLTC